MILNMHRRPPVKDPMSWAYASDEQIVAMVEAADRGEIDLADYWNVGDERVVHLSAMTATGDMETHAEQDVVFVLMHSGGKTLNKAVASGRTECSFIVGQKDSLNERGYMNSSNTNSGGWEASARRGWCNNIYYNSIPSSIRSIFKQVKNKTAGGGRSTTSAIESVDYFALPAEYEICGSYSYSSTQYENELFQFDYYKTKSNRSKKVDDSATVWWSRSPDHSGASSFVSITAGGMASNMTSTRNSCGISPFGCI